MAVNGTRGFAGNVNLYDDNHADPFIKPLKKISKTNMTFYWIQSRVYLETSTSVMVVKFNLQHAAVRCRFKSRIQNIIDIHRYTS